MLYEARQAEISDQLTKIKSAEDRKATKVTKKILKMGLSSIIKSIDEYYSY